MAGPLRTELLKQSLPMQEGLGKYQCVQGWLVMAVVAKEEAI